MNYNGQGEEPLSVIILGSYIISKIICRRRYRLAMARITDWLLGKVQARKGRLSLVVSSSS